MQLIVKLKSLYKHYKPINIPAQSNEEPGEEICFSVEEGNMNEKSTKKIGDISSSEDEDFPTSTKKRKRHIEIGDDLD